MYPKQRRYYYTFFFLSPPSSKCLHRLMGSCLRNLHSVHSIFNTIFLVVFAFTKTTICQRGTVCRRKLNWNGASRTTMMMMAPCDLTASTVLRPARQILRPTTFSQPILPLAPIPMCPYSLLRRWRYINHTLTYLHNVMSETSLSRQSLALILKSWLKQMRENTPETHTVWIRPTDC